LYKFKGSLLTSTNLLNYKDICISFKSSFNLQKKIKIIFPGKIVPNIPTCFFNSNFKSIFIFQTMPYKVDASTQTSIPAISLQIQTNDFICVF
jgi:hypothetical protein